MIQLAESVDRAARSAAFQLALKLFSATALVFLFGKIAQVGLHALLARQLGAQLFGQVSVALSVGQVLAVALTVGVPLSGMRFVAGLSAAEEWAALRGYLLFASSVVLGGAALGALGSATYSFFGQDADSARVAGILAMLLPLLLLTVPRSAVMRGLERIGSALLPWEVIAPVTTIGCLLLFPQSDGLKAGAMLAAGIAVGETVGCYLLLKSLPAQVRSVEARFSVKEWLAVSIPLQLYQVGRLVAERADIVLVAFLLGYTEAGLYAIAHRLSMVHELLARISSSVVSPQLARSFHADNQRDLFFLTRPVVALTVVLGVCTYCLLFLVGRLLVTLFGITDEAQVNKTVLVLLVLSVGQIASAVTAPFVQALVMTRFERLAMLLSSGAAILLLVAFPVVLPTHGILGGAIAKTLLLVAVNVVTVTVCLKKLRGRRKGDC